MSGSSSFRRNPLVISGNSLSSGDRTTTFTKGSPDSLLRSYLIFVRDLRGQRREPSIELRSEDITVLAHHLGVTEELVLGGLLDLMGATRAQRSAMLAMLAAGALTVVLSGTIVSSLSSDGVSVEMERLADAVSAAVAGSDGAAATPAANTAAADTRSEASTPNPQAVAASTAIAPSVEPLRESIEPPDALEAPAPERTTATPTADALRSAAAAVAARDAAVTEPPTAANEPGGDTEPVAAGPVATEPVSIGVAPDGSIVASVAPPVPAASDEPVATAELPDGTTVGVAAPPVPPAAPEEPIATAELPDGTVVGVAAPPVPPTPSD